MNNRFLVIMLAAVTIFLGILIFNNKNNQSDAPAAEPTNHTLGQSEVGLNVTEYGDFQCIACFQYHEVLQQLKAKYKDRVVFQYRHFPIVGSHPNAMAAHRAAEAAARQGKFWEMHDKLFESSHFFNEQGRPVPTNWATANNASSTIERYAEEIGLDMEQYRTDVASSEVGAAIQADMNAGNDLGISGTPTFLIDGQKIETPNTLEAFEQLIEEKLKEKSTS